MKTLMERVSGFAQKKPTPVRRGGASYDATYHWACAELAESVKQYQALQIEDQTARLIRDKMDFVLRRYHNYCIKENFGAHYCEVGLQHDTPTEFEHVVPAALARDLLLRGRITIDEALNIPTCKLTREKHRALNATKLGSTTPDIVWFWQRYSSLGIAVETHDGNAVDMTTWNLETHYQYFGVKS